MPTLRQYLAWDSETHRRDAQEVDAATPADAAQLYVDAAQFDADDERTYWVRVYLLELPVTDADTAERDGLYTSLQRVAVHPLAPDCRDIDGLLYHSHVWSDDERLGARLVGRGAGVVERVICTRCLCARVTDTDSTDPVDGRQGLTSIRYERDALTHDELIERLAD